jgi:hypothetical protein
MVVAPEDSRYKPGDQLRVFRLGYWHHGIYLSPTRVIEFGGRISHKPTASIRPVALELFQARGTALVVDNGPEPKILGMGVWHAPPLPADEVVDRAEWLVHQDFPLTFYNLVGTNCEHIATWCATGAAESLQARRVFMPVGGTALFLTAGLSRWRPDLLKRFTPAIGGLTILGFALPLIYNRSARKMYQEFNKYPGIGKWSRNGSS